MATRLPRFEYPHPEGFQIVSWGVTGWSNELEIEEVHCAEPAVQVAGGGPQWRDPDSAPTQASSTVTSSVMATRNGRVFHTGQPSSTS